jgi:hypothetical protein
MKSEILDSQPPANAEAELLELAELEPVEAST